MPVGDSILSKLEDGLEAFEEDITTLSAFFIICFGTGAVLYYVYMCYRPSKEAIESVEKGSLPGTELYEMKKKIEYSTVLLIASYTFFYYSISISFTMYNKWFLNSWEGGFSFPVTASSGHMLVKLILIRMWACGAGADSGLKEIDDSVMFWIVIPIGACTAFDVMLSNSSLLFINLSMYTIIKSSYCVDVYAIGILYGLEKFRYWVMISILLVSCGLALAVYSNAKVNYMGIGMCLMASLFAAVRWVLTQYLFKVDASCKNVFVALYHIAPASAFCLIPVSFVMEWERLKESTFYTDHALGLRVILCVCGGGIIAFWLLILEIKLLEMTSSLTMGILGHCKEVLQIVLAVIIFGEKLTHINITGLAICLAALIWYKYLTHMYKEEEDSYLPVSQVEDESNKGGSYHDSGNDHGTIFKKGSNANNDLKDRFNEDNGIISGVSCGSSSSSSSSSSIRGRSRSPDRGSPGSTRERKVRSG